MVLIQISMDLIRLMLQKSVHVVLETMASCRDCDPRQESWWEEQDRATKGRIDLSPF